MIHSEYNGSFVKFGNNQHIQEIEYFCRDDFNFINILKSIEIEIRGNIPNLCQSIKLTKLQRTMSKLN